MKVKKTSWHYRLYHLAASDEQRKEAPSVCMYLSTLAIKFPLMAAMFTVVMAGVLPFLAMEWLAGKIGLKPRIEKLSARIAHETYCPFGKVEIEP